MMIGVKDQNDKRDAWHHGGWIAKIIIWVVLIVLMFFLPNIVITIYETLSKFGSGFFLFVQVILLLDFTYRWNDAWVEKDEQKWYIALLSVSVVCYLATYSFSGVLFMWFNPSGHDCGLNVFFIVMTMILAFAFAVVALHPQVNGSLLPASVISVYCAYLCYSGLSSSSKPLLEEGEVESGKDDKKESEARPVTYSYTFFHLTFALASMYSAMLLTGWTSSTSDSSELIDVGWTSVWVRICTEWATAALYIWTLLAPLILPDREF
ncbi:putative serine incorporator [Cocos nucifera]|uniref:Putative serine incorporator n=1 Tax=Cocos nucifera TaxID=13894 RepID=A0A8K0IXN4_COCNU|nr:putative serine incorporator [Cocos nucifera]